MESNQISSMSKASRCEANEPMPSESQSAYLGLGSNLNDREACLYRAVTMLSNAGARCVKASSIYESEPFGYSDQPAFLNAVIKVKTFLSVQALLITVKEVERRMGRISGPRWGPRLIDIDILLYDDVTLATEELTVPHPGLRHRVFVLLPLHEIAPRVNIDKDLSVEKALESLDTSQGIKKYASWRYGDVR
ncbi:MAG: 2-amino-4-hydroxy-6-hydroxymethyldihydropteridine diphosphokinase [bacterium]|jgi:2-amino-4-hydroxy-6-hydroxymethyldihydropteridine diphosphokinase|nr:2-amino-4-hydroxy-6-hydroxymethyldihydropteridine diphosphokinase [bacterium]MDD3806029.1 2-amino-4-hydroxy-6-hydroxymethyldihydropteridine diphosphokinase [bacterium]MDD4153508.1 2-amino-4-hydroxy-6-hydroxymethyldihydropteridine diphosphokinase [bacterium]